MKTALPVRRSDPHFAVNPLRSSCHVHARSYRLDRRPCLLACVRARGGGTRHLHRRGHDGRRYAEHAGRRGKSAGHPAAARLHRQPRRTRDPGGEGGHLRPRRADVGGRRHRQPAHRLPLQWRERRRLRRFDHQRPCRRRSRRIRLASPQRSRRCQPAWPCRLEHGRRGGGGGRRARHPQPRRRRALGARHQHGVGDRADVRRGQVQGRAGIRSRSRGPGAPRSR